MERDCEQIEKNKGVEMLKELLKERLMAAADEIFALFERTIASYEEELCRTREEKERHRQQVEAFGSLVLNMKDPEPLIDSQEERPPQPQWGSSTLTQVNPAQPPHIKEEVVEHWPEGADLTKLPLTVVCLKTEDHEDKPQESSQLHHSPSEENRWAELPSSSSTEANGDHRGGPLSRSNNEDVTQEPLSGDPDWEVDMRTPPDHKHSGPAKKKTHEIRFTCSVCAKGFSYMCDLTRHTRTHTGEKPFACSVCGNTFSQRSILKTHMKIHTGEKPFSCPICGARFFRKSHMVLHMRTHTGEKPFGCLVCGRRFAQRYILQTHMRTHTGEKPFSCSFCGERFSQKVQMVAHVKAHTGEKPFSCSICGAGFFRKAHAASHMRTHAGDKTSYSLATAPASCSVVAARKLSKMLKELVKERLMAAADEIFALFERTIASYEEELCRTREEKERHRQQLEAAWKTQIVLNAEDAQQSMGAEERPPQQQGRTSTFELEDPQPPHVKEEAEELWTAQEGPCLLGPTDAADITPLPLTGVSVKTEDDEDKPPEPSLLQHSHMTTGAEDGGHPLRVHADPQPSECSKRQAGKERFTCSVCAKSFTYKCNLNFHMQSHYQKPFGCSICEKRFTQKANMITHMRTHTGEKPFSCSVCGERFAQKVNMLSHMRTHTGEKLFSCSVCDRRFSRKANVVTHMRTHTGEKPFGCSVCGKQFFQKSTMVSHMRTHTGEKPFSCSICGKRFFQKSNMVSHTRTHTEERPFNCSVCEKRFTQKAYMLAHMKRHAGDGIFPCSLCTQTFARGADLTVHMSTHSRELKS
uniref:zinc finger protein 432-like n=1 Tax=Doryrhamphus excisus TaxID=161450 RepID=UPI0025AEA4B7|nr:zinc finger protein 432-like [Doryrhamphus excisus]